MKFRTKPFEIEALLYDGTNADEITAWSGNMFYEVEEEDRTDDPDCIAAVFDKLHSTWVGVKEGQWIIRGMKGEYYPCDPEVFAEKYESMDEIPRPDIKRSGVITSKQIREGY
jgi:hypothetical protein